MFEEPKTPSRLGRFRQIVQVLARHGYGWFLAQLGLDRRIPFRWRVMGQRAAMPYTPPEHLRHALQELGTTFIKVGQILSTRSDMLAPEYVAELSLLQDTLPPAPIEAIEAQIQLELGSPPSEIFAEFDPVPIGSASIGQVHAARLRSGEEVVVKVQRPGVEGLVEEDLGILRDLSGLASSRTIWGRIYDLPGMVDEFTATLRAELNYVQEGRNIERFRKTFAREPRLRIPAVYWNYSTRRVLTMERLHGIKINDLQAMDAAGIDRRKLAEIGASVVLRMVLEDGFFHADPHPGNFLVGEGDVLCMMDFGMVGQVDDATREGLLYLLLAVSNKDIDRVVDQLVSLGVVGTTAQLDRLRADVNRLLSLYWGVPVGEIRVAPVLEEFLDTARRHQLRVPTSLALLGKTMGMNEGLARSLDPKFDITTVLKPYIFYLVRRSYNPRRLRKQLFPTLFDMARLATTLPRRTERLLAQVERGNISMSMRIVELDQALDALNGMTNRLILALLVSSFTVGIALLLQIYHGLTLQWLVGGLLGVGMVIVLALGLWLAFNILRRGLHW